MKFLLAIVFLFICLAAFALKGSDPAEKRNPWYLLSAAQTKSPCLIDHTKSCLLKQAADIKISSGQMFDLKQDWGLRSDTELLDAIIEAGDAKLARRLLPLLPPDARVRRMQLLFTSGDYAEADKLLASLKADPQGGRDNGVVWALLRRGDPDKALQIAETTISWKPPPMKEHISYIHAVLCGSEPSHFPLAIMLLAERFAEQKDYEKALKAARLIEQYKDHGFYGDVSSNCLDLYVRRAYYGAMIAIDARLKKDGEAAKQKAVWSELKAVADRELSGTYLESFTADLIKNGLRDEALQMIGTAVRHVTEQGYPDTAAIIWTQAGQYGDALKRIDTFPDTPDFRNTRIDTLFGMAHIAQASGDRATLALLLDRLMPMLGTRTKSRAVAYREYGEHQLEMDGASDQMEFASLAQAANRLAASREAMKKAFSICSPLKTCAAFREDALMLVLRLGDYADAERMATADGWGYLSYDVLAYYAHNDLWPQYDRLVSLFNSTGGDADTENVPEDLTQVLIAKKQFGRLAKLFGILPGGYPASSAVTSALVFGFDHENALPAPMFQELWLHHFENCEHKDEATPSQRLSGCYLDLYHYRSDP